MKFTPRPDAGDENLLADVAEFAAESLDQRGKVAPLFVAVAARRAWRVLHLAINAQHFGHFFREVRAPRPTALPPVADALSQHVAWCLTRSSSHQRAITAGHFPLPQAPTRM